MKMKNTGLSLLSVDAGKESTKYIIKNEFGIERGIFKTKVQKTYNFGVDIEKNSFLVDYNNQQYLVGEMVKDSKSSYDLSKKSIEHKICIYIAAAKAMKKTGNNRFKIAIGAPLTTYKNLKAKNEYREYILDNGHINININGEKFDFYIDDVLVLPECIGPVFNQMEEFRKMRLNIVDIGGLNVNLCRFHKMVPEVGSMLVANKGANILKAKIADKLSEIFGIIIYKDDVEQILEDGMLYINGKPKEESKTLIRNIMEEHLEDIIRFAKQNELDIFSSNGKVVFTGGGSLLLKEVIQSMYPNAQIATDAQFSNALAFYKVLSIKNEQA
ncbi:hypothetical protein DWV12_16260 [Clostridium botulinum]|nr:hypothetical protein [Clostridium botulinum]MCS6108870.1 hypothetical protein [Clostridium botulinum]